MKFTKMHGCGNDYVYVNAFEEKIPDPADTAKRLSDRHFGIGSDGLILIAPSDAADFQMIMYNADGSRSQMCGNGIRCVAKYVYDHGMTDSTVITVETLAGIKTLYLTVQDGKVQKVRVDMGEPILTPAQIPVIMPENEAAQPTPSQSAYGNDTGTAAPLPNRCTCGDAAESSSADHSTFGYDASAPAPGESARGRRVGAAAAVIAQPFEVDGRTLSMTCVSMGNPHTITFLEDVASLKIEGIGPLVECHPRFPERVNAEFVRVIDRQNVEMRVWERGTGETLACGTGSCATAVACVLNGLTDRSINVHLLGGTLEIFWDETDNHVYMTGPAEEVFSGQIEL